VRLPCDLWLLSGRLSYSQGRQYCHSPC
jgi:hypothetical protein